MNNFSDLFKEYESLTGAYHLESQQKLVAAKIIEQFITNCSANSDVELAREYFKFSEPYPEIFRSPGILNLAMTKVCQYNNEYITYHPFLVDYLWPHCTNLEEIYAQAIKAENFKIIELLVTRAGLEAKNLLHFKNRTDTESKNIRDILERIEERDRMQNTLDTASNKKNQIQKL